MRKAHGFRDPPRIVDVDARAARPFFRQGRTVIIKLKRDPDHVISFVLQHGGDDGTVHAARHGDDDAGFRRWFWQAQRIERARVEGHGNSPWNPAEYRKIRNTLKGGISVAVKRHVALCLKKKRRSSQMFLKKIEGPRAVRLPDGSTMTRADLPAKETRRWVASRKAAVVKAVTFGLISHDQAKDHYGLSDEELLEWVKAATEHGEDALKVTRVQKYRQP